MSYASHSKALMFAKKAKFNILIWTITLWVSVLFCGCEGNSTSPNGEDCYILVLYSKDGLGDNGFLDNIYRAFKKNEVKYSFILENVTPTTDSMAIHAIERFFNDPVSDAYKHRLLVLVSDYYEPLLKKHPKWKQGGNNSILLFDSDNDSFDTYVRGTSLYGASFLAGATVKKMKRNKPVIFAANRTTKEIKRAVDGFIDGFNYAGGAFDSTSLIYLIDGAEDSLDQGFNLSQDLYHHAAVALGEKNDFVFPIAGGSNDGLYRFIRDYDDKIPFLTCGIDTDQHHQSDKIVFSIEKHTEKIIDKFIKNWIEGKSQPQKEFYTFESDYINIVFHDGYDNWEKSADKLKDKAIEAERKYLEGK